MNYDLKIVIWNARGLNARARRMTIRSLICTTEASIVCIQETKMELICSSTVLETLGSEFDEYVYLPAAGTRGGILLAWKSRSITLSDQTFTTNTLSAKVSTPGTARWWLTVLYGP
ncbi:hypothetical protein ZWY2020_035680 [Hordeum vulgare]|nr:hypothetical protein ZWY2020_035680 [Hordeum vulgare]